MSILKIHRPDSQLRCYACEKFCKPVATHVTRWASDQYSFGAYSYVPAGGTQVGRHTVFWHACQCHSLCHLSLGADTGTWMVSMLSKRPVPPADVLRPVERPADGRLRVRH